MTEARDVGEDKGAKNILQQTFNNKIYKLAAIKKKKEAVKVFH